MAVITISDGISGVPGVAEDSPKLGRKKRTGGLSTMGLTPGTPLMLELQQSLEFYACQRLQQRWPHLIFELSSATVQVRYLLFGDSCLNGDSSKLARCISIVRSWQGLQVMQRICHSVHKCLHTAQQ